MDWSFLGKKRSKFGRFLDKNELTQQEVVKRSGVSRGTISRLCQPESEDGPTMKNASKIIRALRDLTGKDVHFEDFWRM
ncbi:transcriptional regulator [Neobacillus piezotolerans]|uniref:Transcriptional regulator n=1 Tax=Neobacillus piezotolerans TaxID=2259171 RepID=A0A3D8GM61_9BACI|nr:helix-turn-helix transcriptional regulator [Neobacillus piezotolerans]RDU35488.1 transcriptional regulator [Neobacillus piezotolerans]